MKSFLSLALAVSLLHASFVTCQAQTVEQPKPGPEHKQLERWVGKWTYSGNGHSNPFFPTGKFNGALTRRMVLDGFFLEEQWEDKNESGYLARGVILTGYDPATKRFMQYQFENDGSVSPSALKIDGNSWGGQGTRADRQGKSYETRFAYELSEDETTDGGKVEYSSDGGKTWKPWFDITFKKVKE
jgi:hypothetical protein